MKHQTHIRQARTYRQARPLYAAHGIFLTFLLLGLGAIPKVKAQCAASETPVNVITESAIGFFGSDQFSWALRNAGTNALIDTFTCGQFWFGDDIRQSCLDTNGTYKINFWDRGGDGWLPGGGGYRVENASTGCLIGAGIPDNGFSAPLNPFDCIDNELEEVFTFDLANVVGCTDPSALNYDPCATIDGGCIFPMANNECVDAIPLDVNPDGSCAEAYLGTTIGATGNPTADPAASSACGDADPFPADVWFTVDMPSSGVVKLLFLQTPGSSMNVDVYTGSNCGSLVNSTTTACSNYFAFDTVTVTEVPGSTVYVRVWDFGSDLFGTIELCATDPAAAGTCSTANPPTNPQATVSASNVTLSWDPIPNSVACQVQGRPLGAPGVARFNILGAEPSSRSFPLGVFSPATDYEWQVRCACSTSPVDATDFTALDTFTTPSLRAGQQGQAAFLDLRAYPNPANQVLMLELESLKAMESMVQISNVLGQVVLQKPLAIHPGSNNIALDIGGLGEGVYRIHYPGYAQAVQFVVAR